MADMSYGSTATITMASGLGGLANGFAFVSTAVSNVTDVFLDNHVWVKAKASASASVNAILVIRCLAGSELHVADASASASVSSDAVRNIPVIGVMALGTSATGSATSLGGPYSIAQAFGGFMPQSWSIVVENRSGVSLQDSADAHSVIRQGLKIV